MTKLTIPSSDAKTTSTSSPTRGIQSHFTREAKINSFRKVSFLKGHLSLSNNNNNEILKLMKTTLPGLTVRRNAVVVILQIFGL